SLRLLPDSTYFTYTNDSRNDAQVIDGGWGADYPSADDFLGKLTCNHFAPRNGPATTDASEFCDPALDNQIARAAALQTTDPSARPPRNPPPPPRPPPCGPGSPPTPPPPPSGCPPPPPPTPPSSPPASATTSTPPYGEPSSTSSGSGDPGPAARPRAAPPR